MVEFRVPPVRRSFWRNALFSGSAAGSPQAPAVPRLPSGLAAEVLPKGPVAQLPRPWETAVAIVQASSAQPQSVQPAGSGRAGFEIRGCEDFKGKFWHLSSWVPGITDPSWTAIFPSSWEGQAPGRQRALRPQLERKSDAAVRASPRRLCLASDLLHSSEPWAGPLLGLGVCKAVAFQDDMRTFFFFSKRNSTPCMSFSVLKLIHSPGVSLLFPHCLFRLLLKVRSYPPVNPGRLCGQLHILSFQRFQPPSIYSPSPLMPPQPWEV